MAPPHQLPLHQQSGNGFYAKSRESNLFLIHTFKIRFNIILQSKIEIFKLTFCLFEFSDEYLVRDVRFCDEKQIFQEIRLARF